ncbi:hypothetical protein GCM10027034_27550 [Ramlibacter solisilvae]|uniref:Lipoprotein n=1 Tax=Ramlibacter tataouinensis TaxID=94132 RepID=A0A127JR65_9BURK|nr:hypothetical protein [Ramlibacter tataouinensis]AMO22405.1 hypothetical protein UC35_05195 [Ramlibacter tataouinensis]
MKILVPAIVTALALSACASNSAKPESAPQAQAQQADACRNVEAPTGSRLVRKADCNGGSGAATTVR